MNILGYTVETWQLVVAGAGTLFLVWFSWWASLKEKRWHGVFRFFSFESVLMLVVFNSRHWFRSPFSFWQIASWLLLAASLLLALWGFLLLRRRGAPQGKMETTTQLVESGIYRLIRHPMYSSLLLLGTGVYLKHISWPTTVLAVVNALAVYFTARIEEGEMRTRFGPAYESYRKRTKMFLPFLF